jgi:iron complex outermembrane receptor protein
VRASTAGTWHDRTFGDDINRDLRGFALGEVTVSGTDRGHTWVAGAAIQRDWYRSQDLPSFDYTHAVPALFAQDEYALGAKLGLSASARFDFDDEHGTFFSPLVSALVRPREGWNLRLSAGKGYSAPVPFTEETDVVGLWRVLPLRDVKSERATTASLDVGWSTRGFEANATLFASEVGDPLVFRESAVEPGLFEIANAARPARTLGSELLARVTVGPQHLIATYTYVHSTEADQSGTTTREAPLTPRHAGELAWIWEEESRGRVGVEVSYTGAQRLGHDPYRGSSPSYVEVNALAELRIRETRVFVNAVNLTDVRQTHFDPLVLPARATDGRWTTDVWAPLEGRVFNAGVRFEF